MRDLAHPGEPEDEVDDDRTVVEIVGTEAAVATQAEWMFGVTACGGEEGEVPILGDVPVEGVEGIDKREKDPVIN